MAPKLYYFLASPPCRAILMVAKAIGLELELEKVEKEQLKTPEMLKINPQHTVPLLVDSDENFALWDSHAIAGYLVGKYAEDDTLYPKDDLKKRALIDQRLHFESGILFERGKRCIMPLFNGASEIAKENKDSILEALEFLDSFLNDKQWIAGDNVTIADLSILAILATLDTIITVDADRFPRLVSWFQRAKKLPYYEECNNEGLELFKRRITNFKK